MVSYQASPTRLLLLLALTGGFLPAVAIIMLGPLLVDLARAFSSSIAVVGQLAAATDLAWGLTALLIGGLADTYGPRPMLLTGLLLMACGLLAAALAWQYGALLACRVLTGVGGVMVVATSVAMIAEAFAPIGRGRAMGWWASATGCGAAVGWPRWRASRPR
jgi:predicted MFS family arabinose efflux permease